MEVSSLKLDDQIALAQALIAKGPRIEELTAKRAQLVTDLAEVDAELTEILGTPTNGSNRAAQKCSVCGQEGHSKRTCPQKGASS